MKKNEKIFEKKKKNEKTNKKSVLITHLKYHNNQCHINKIKRILKLWFFRP